MTRYLQIVTLFFLQGILSDAAIPPKLPDYIYELCNVSSVNCLVGWDSLDERCLDHKNCTTMVAFQKKDDFYAFWTLTQLTPDVAYVALGFSTDQTMGDDGVVECIQEVKGEAPNIHLSYTKGKKGAVRLGDEKYNGSTIANDEYLYCAFTLAGGLDFGNFSVSLDGDEEYYLFGVAGPAKIDGQNNVVGVGKHTASKLISDKTFFKTSSGSLASAYFTLIFTLLILIKTY